jgi:hypothetical protein
LSQGPRRGSPFSAYYRWATGGSDARFLLAAGAPLLLLIAGVALALSWGPSSQPNRTALIEPSATVASVETVEATAEPATPTVVATVVTANTTTAVPLATTAPPALPATAQPSPPAPSPGTDCSVGVQLSEAEPLPGTSITITGSLTCDGSGVGDVTMVASVRYGTSTTSCSADSNPDGTAACEVVVGRPAAGVTAQVNACFGYRNLNYCVPASFRALPAP